MRRCLLPIAGSSIALAAMMLCNSALGQTTSQGAFGSRTTGGTQGTTAPRTGSTGNQNGSTNGVTLMQDVDGGVSGGERFMRGNRGGQFVGAGNEDARLTGVNQAIGAGGSRGPQRSMFSGGNILGQLMQGQGQFNQQFRGQQGGGQAGRTPIRIPIRLGFTSTPAPPATFTAQFQKRLGRLPALTTVGPIEVQLEGDTVVLRGTVASEGDRQLAEVVARLEPAVSKVRNELVVQPADTSGEALPVPTTATP